MNKRIFSTTISLLGASAMLLAAMPASAALLATQVNASASTSLGLGVKAQATTIAAADVKINARVAALNLLETRINQMVRVSGTDKAALDATLQGAVSEMTTLKAKIDADTDAATLKTDVQSITKSYRIYLLVLPQGRITAAADRVMDIVGLFNDLSAKLQLRITEAQTAGQNVTALNASLSDMNAKTSDANIQAEAAVNEIINLQPDNGVQATFQSNLAALKDARAKIKVAAADLKTARQDAGSIVKALASMKISAAATSTTTAK